MAPVLVVLTVIVVAVLCLVGVGVFGWLSWRRPVADLFAPRADGAATIRTSAPDPAAQGTLGETSDRVVRVLALIFLASVSIAVFLTDPTSAKSMAIVLLIAAALLTIVLLQDIVPLRDSRARYWSEAVAATIFLALLTGLTGGVHSPFFVGFLLVVAGASLSLDEVAPLVLAVLAGAAFSLVVVANSIAPDQPFSTDQFFRDLPTLAFDLVILGLLAYIAAVVAREQRRARESALSLSRVDALTGLSNRAGLVDAIEREIRRSERSRRPFAVLMFDLDNLKPVNDQLGHQVGDDLLRAIADAVRRNVRSTDVAGRYGGDEFIVLLGDTDVDGAETKAERLRTEIASVVVGSADRPARTTASFGLVTFPDDGATVEDLIQNADLAMYQAKRGGKNQIVGYVRRTKPITKEPVSDDDEPTTPTGDRRSGGPRPPASRADAAAAPARPAEPAPSQGPIRRQEPAQPEEPSGPPGAPLGDPVERAPWDSTASPAAWETRRLGNRGPR
jgi:diguanylate cyclase (GGDEF)-like protein